MCKTPLSFLQKYWVCNVSTCNRKRTGLIFCSVTCYDAHVPMMNHRESWAEERKAPSAQEWKEQQENPPKRAPRAPKAAAPAPEAESASPAAAKAKPVIIRRPGGTQS